MKANNDFGRCFGGMSNKTPNSSSGRTQDGEQIHSAQIVIHLCASSFQHRVMFFPLNVLLFCLPYRSYNSYRISSGLFHCCLKVFCLLYCGAAKVVVAEETCYALDQSLNDEITVFGLCLLGKMNPVTAVKHSL